VEAVAKARGHAPSKVVQEALWRWLAGGGTVMRNPHVVTISYRLGTGPSLRFDHPPPLEYDTDEFTLRLAEGLLTCAMKVHYATTEEARAVVDPRLRAWELDVALRQGRRAMHFVYQNAHIIDRDPPPPGASQVIMTTSVGSLEMIGEATLTLIPRHYPAPPERFIVSPDVETLWRRYEGYVQGHEPLPGMAYVCQSFIEKVLARGQPDAANKIEQKVLRTLGNLHSH
jgi:hypothetical protein